MNSDTYLSHVRSDGEALAAAAALGFDEPVPNCPGWTVGDLVHHIGGVHRNKTYIVQQGSMDPPRDWEEPARPPDGDLLEWYRRGLDELLGTLGSADPSQPVWTWAEKDQTVGFWCRRMAQETLIHRVDAEQARGDVSPIDDGLATDGIDEIVTVFLSGAPDWATIQPDTGVVRLRVPTRSWDLQYGRFSGTSPSGTTYTDLPAFIVLDEAVPDTVVSGSGSDLDLWLWGRGPIERLSVTGDQALATGIRDIAAEATQ